MPYIQMSLFHITEYFRDCIFHLTFETDFVKCIKKVFTDFIHVLFNY